MCEVASVTKLTISCLLKVPALRRLILKVYITASRRRLIYKSKRLHGTYAFIEFFSLKLCIYRVSL